MFGMIPNVWLIVFVMVTNAVLSGVYLVGGLSGRMDDDKPLCLTLTIIFLANVAGSLTLLWREIGGL